LGEGAGHEQTKQQEAAERLDIFVLEKKIHKFPSAVTIFLEAHPSLLADFRRRPSSQVEDAFLAGVAWYV
jgi:hypothetical protein